MKKDFYFCAACAILTSEQIIEKQKQEIEALQEETTRQAEEIASLQIKRAAATAVFDMLLAGEEVDEALVLAARNL
jgi:DNA-binding protein H-NS